MGLISGGVSASDLILDGQSVSLYVGGNPPIKVWPTGETVQITLGTDLEARDQFRAALVDRGLDYRTVEEIPFDIELVGTGSVRDMFRGCAALTTAPAMDTSGVTNMRSMFNACNVLTTVPAMDTSNVTNMGWMFTHCYELTSIPAMDTSQVTAMNNMFDYCTSLTYVPDLDTAQVTNVNAMFLGCSALTDGNVRLNGRNPDVTTTAMIDGSGLTRQPFYSADGTPIDVVQITMGSGMEARDQFRAELTARGLDYTTITEVPFDIELVVTGSSTGASQQLFYGCRELTSVPPLDTSNVWNMNGMFQLCGSLVTIPPLDTSNVWNAPSMFAYCGSLTSVPDMDAAKMTNVTHMFTGCTALTDGNVRLIGRNPTVNTSSMISSSGLTREPWYTADGTPIAPREVTILSAMGGFEQSATGDTDLVSGWPYAAAYGPSVTFAAPVTCNRNVRIINERNFGVNANAGTTISAGTMVIPGDYSGGVAHVFTEVW